MDASSEVIHSLLPAFMFTALGISAAAMGFNEGAVEATALIVTVSAGALARSTSAFASRSAKSMASASNGVYALTAYPCGKLADLMNHRRLLAWGLPLLIAADLALAWDGHWSIAWLGVVLWGLHLAMTQGLLAAMIADTAPADLRGTAYGFFNLSSGLAMLLASVVAGLLWDGFGARATFLTGGIFSASALALLLSRPSWRKVELRRP